MFTGIVQEVGRLKRKLKASDKYKLIIEAEDFLDDVSIGDSIAVNGVCLTVVKINSNTFTVDVMPETVKSTNLDDVHKTTPLNLEKSLQPYNFMGGHIVSGHVDGTGRVESIKKEKNSRLVDMKVSEDISKYIVDKGSVALNGVSLTIADLKDNSISVSIIPETWNSTNFKYLKTGDKLNIEVDIVGKYVDKLMNKKQEEKEKKEKITKDLLRENGFI